ncbi:MAG: GspH/FimT family pseudopilin [Arenicella sp.]
MNINVKKRLKLSSLSRGFTIFELMIAVAVLGVLLAIAAPNFSDFIEKQKVKSDAQSVAKALSYARAEALVSPSQATVVAFNETSADITIKDTSTNIDQTLKPGFLAVMESGTMEFLTVVNYRESDSLSVHNDADNRITFNAFGGLVGGSFSMLFCGERSAEKHALQVDVNQTGRVSQNKKPVGGALNCPT